MNQNNDPIHQLVGRIAARVGIDAVPAPEDGARAAFRLAARPRLAHPPAGPAGRPSLEIVATPTPELAAPATFRDEGASVDFGGVEKADRVRFGRTFWSATALLVALVGVGAGLVGPRFLASPEKPVEPVVTAFQEEATGAEVQAGTGLHDGGQPRTDPADVATRRGAGKRPEPGEPENESAQQKPLQRTPTQHETGQQQPARQPPVPHAPAQQQPPQQLPAQQHAAQQYVVQRPPQPGAPTQQQSAQEPQPQAPTAEHPPAQQQPVQRPSEAPNQPRLSARELPIESEGLGERGRWDQAKVELLRKNFTNVYEGDSRTRAQLTGALEWTELCRDKVVAEHAVERTKKGKKLLADLDVPLCLAVISVESEGTPTSVSPSVRAMGLMQLTLNTVSQYKVTDDLMNPDVNVTVGVRFLADVLVRHKKLRKALMDYNGGPALAKDEHPEVKRYAQEVMARTNALRKIFKKADLPRHGEKRTKPSG